MFAMQQILSSFFSRSATKHFRCTLHGALFHALGASTPSVSPFRKILSKTLFENKISSGCLVGQAGRPYRGHGYSNSFTLCRGRALVFHMIRTPIVWAQSAHVLHATTNARLHFFAYRHSS